MLIQQTAYLCFFLKKIFSKLDLTAINAQGAQSLYCEHVEHVFFILMRADGLKTCFKKLTFFNEIDIYKGKHEEYSKNMQ